MQTWAMQRLAFDTEQAMPLHYITMEVSEMKYIVFDHFFCKFLLFDIIFIFLRIGTVTTIPYCDIYYT